MSDPRQFRAALRGDLAFFYRKCFATVSPNDTYSHNWHIDAMSHALGGVARGETQNLIITLPPRNGKSLLGSVAFPAWLLGHNPMARVICASYAQPLAGEFSNQTRSIMASNWYRDTFPGTVLSPRKNSESEFQTTRHGGRLATSVGGVLTGRGGDVVIIDDPLKPSDADSEAMREAAKAWFDLTVSSRLNDKKRGAFVLIMQRLHVDDLAGHLLDKGGWTHLNLPAIAEKEERIPIGFGRHHQRRAGDLLHPEREPMRVLDQMKANLGPNGFSAQYQQDPVPAGGNMIAWDWFRRFAVEPRRRPGDTVVQSWDTASKAGELNDYSVCTTWLMRDGFYYLLDLQRARLDAPSLRGRVMALYERHKPELVLIEDKSSGISLIQELRHATAIPIQEIVPEGDKTMRAFSQAASIAGGKVWLPAEAPWLDDLKTEVLAFPNGRHDDQVDSMVQFMIWAFDDVYNAPRIREL
ncbi:phage terminase large subunit [Lichenibacterium dinghuense]|uniref:phage terminase large subunit n=1 Tax=Lichenibacterium dinghuense TaxID=2895977 RepID=UPI001F385D3E|nr:phage terminase large subunit [Lichenibacterium sp. 6Y81]